MNCEEAGRVAVPLTALITKAGPLCPKSRCRISPYTSAGQSTEDETGHGEIQNDDSYYLSG